MYGGSKRKGGRRMLKIMYTGILLVLLLQLKLKLSMLKFKELPVVHVLQHWSYCHNFHLSQTGRIRIAWDTNIWQCLVISTSLLQITLKMRNQGGLEGFFAIVYGENK